jgi:hypothetical protein
VVTSLSWRSTSVVYHVVSTTHTPRFLSAFLIMIEVSFFSDVIILCSVLLRGVVVKGTVESL